MIRRNWTREELIIVFNLYCTMEFSKINYKHPLIQKLSEVLNRTPSAIAWKLVNFASLDPSLQKQGIKGASNASKLDKQIFEEFTNDWEKLVLESEILLAKIKVNDDIDEVNFELKEGKEITSKVKTRVNQGFFRSTILSAYKYKCCLTGIEIPDLLVASHIIPWSKDKKNRLNPQNGLCLNNLHDKAFDRGYISFDNDYKVILSNEIKNNKNESIKKYFWELEGKQIVLPNKFIPNTMFLEYHRENIFQN